MHYTEVEEYLLNIPKFTKKNSLENTAYLLEKLNNPQENMKIIHVAGTNGKGSVCAYTASILKEAGYLVGLFTSPHLVDIKERFQINGQVIDEQDFLEAFHRIKETSDEVVKEGLCHPSFFEFLFLMSILIFHKKKVQYAVLETGLGGRLDATNVIKNPVMTIITSISYDHTEYLGDTLDKIAFEKAGIIKQGVPIVFDGDKEEVTGVIAKVAHTKGSKPISVSENDYEISSMDDKSIDFSINSSYDEGNTFRVNNPAAYQVKNAVLAIKAIRELFYEHGIANTLIKEGIIKTVWPGRMEQIAPGIYVDGAHNLDGITSFVETAKRLAIGKKVEVLFSAVSDKDYHKMIEYLLKELECNQYYITRLQNNRALSLDDMYRCFEEATNKPIILCENTDFAFKEIHKNKTDESVVFCVGSLYLVGEIKRLIGR